MDQKEKQIWEVCSMSNLWNPMEMKKDIFQVLDISMKNVITLKDANWHRDLKKIYQIAMITQFFKISTWKKKILNIS